MPSRHYSALKYRRKPADIFFICLGAPPLLYPAAPPSVFACGKYTAPAVALEREEEEIGKDFII